MKSMIKLMALLTALLLIATLAACGPAEEPAESPTQAPTQAATEAPTQASTEASEEAPTEPDYSPFLGNWYSGYVTLTVDENRKWTMQYRDETFLVGQAQLGGDGALYLYDTEGMDAAVMHPEEDGTLYTEIFRDEIHSHVEDCTFQRTKPENLDSDAIGDDGIVEDAG